MDNYYNQAAKILTDLKDGGQIVCGPTKENVYAIVGVRAKEVCYDVLVGETKGLTKELVSKELYSLEEHHDAMCKAHSQYNELCVDKAFKAMMMLSSGHVYFDIAILEKGQITWCFSLEE